jgi:esterase
MARSESIFIPVADDRRLHVRRVGSGQPPCVFIHGFADGGYVWDGFIRSSLSTQTMLTVDLPGHGDSSWCAHGSYEVGQIVADLETVVDAFDLQRFVLVGHSLGGNLALRLSARLQERVVGLVVVDTAPRPSAQARAYLLNELAESAMCYETVEQFVAWVQARRPMVSPKLIQHIAAHALRANDDGRFEFKADPKLGQLISGNDETELWPIIRQVRCPALIVRGAQSGVLSPEAAEQVVRELRSARLSVVAGAGHSVMFDNPAGFRDAVAPFIKSFAAASPARAMQLV